jgi:hypothetical protein
VWRAAIRIQLAGVVELRAAAYAVHADLSPHPSRQVPGCKIGQQQVCRASLTGRKAPSDRRVHTSTSRDSTRSTMLLGGLLRSGRRGWVLRPVRPSSFVRLPILCRGAEHLAKHIEEQRLLTLAQTDGPSATLRSLDSPESGRDSASRADQVDANQASPDSLSRSSSAPVGIGQVPVWRREPRCGWCTRLGDTMPELLALVHRRHVEGLGARAIAKSLEPRFKTLGVQPPPPER